MNITSDSVLIIINKTVDILIVWWIFYHIFKSIKNNVKLALIFKGVLAIAFLKIMADLLNLVTVGTILQYVIMWSPIALIVIFQPEIREILEELGRNQLLLRKKILTVNEREKVVMEIVSALDAMKQEKTGALIVIERDTPLNDYISKAKKVNADVTSYVLQAIFYEGNPLHDGGVIIQGDRIACASAVFPTSGNIKNKRLGTRHRAAVGLSEQTDALVLVVSEETGRLSIAIRGELYYNVSIEDAKMTLLDELRPKKALDFADEEEEAIYEENK